MLAFLPITFPVKAVVQNCLPDFLSLFWCSLWVSCSLTSMLLVSSLPTCFSALDSPLSGSQSQRGISLAPAFPHSSNPELVYLGPSVPVSAMPPSLFYLGVTFLIASCQSISTFAHVLPIPPVSCFLAFSSLPPICLSLPPSSAKYFFQVQFNDCQSLEFVCCTKSPDPLLKHSWSTCSDYRQVRASLGRGRAQLCSLADQAVRPQRQNRSWAAPCGSQRCRSQ